MIRSTSLIDSWPLSPNASYGQASLITNENYAQPTFISALELKDCTIPCVDILGIAALEGDERIKQTEAFCDSLHESGGLVAIKAENLIPLVRCVYQQSQAYFDQSDELKKEDLKDEQSGANGYIPFTKNGLIETYTFNSKFLKPPTHLPDFKKVMLDCYDKLDGCMKCALQLILEYCHEKNEEISQELLETNHFINLLKYGAVKPEESSETIWRKEHADLTALTILPHASVPGLQVFKEGKWIDVQVPEGCLLLMVGEYLQYKSAGYFQAPLHQVIIPEGKWRGEDRYALAFGAQWKSNIRLKPFEGCIEKVCGDFSAEQKDTYLEDYRDFDVLSWFQLYKHGIIGRYKFSKI